MLDLGYPGGGIIDRLGAQGDPAAIAFPRPYLDKDRFDFSFSGLKSAVGRHLQTHPAPDDAAGGRYRGRLSGGGVVDVLCHKLIRGARARGL